MRRMIFVIAAMLISVVAIAGDSPFFGRYGKLTADDFRATDWDDVGCDAVILQNEKSMRFDEYQGSLRLFSTYHLRLKILKDGFSDPDFFKVEFSGKHGYERVLNYRMCVYSLNAGKVTKDKIKSKLTFYQCDSLESWVAMELPSLRRGQVVDWEYTVVSFDFMMPDLCMFNCRYPSVANLLVTDFPDFMQYKYDLRGSDTLAVSHTRNNGFVSIGYNYTPQDNPGSLAFMQGRRRSLQINYRFNSVCDSFVTFNTIPLDWLPEGERNLQYGTASVRMKAAKFTQNIGYYGVYYTAWQQLTHLIYVYSDPDNRYLSPLSAWNKMYNSGFVIVDSQNWKRLHKRLTRSPDFWKPMLKNNGYPHELDYLMDPDEETDTARVIRDVCGYVSSHYKWNNLYNNHLPNGLKDVRQNGSGTSAEINMLLVSYLRHYGVGAFPVLAVTKDFGDVDSTYANIQQFNTVLACVRLNKLASDNREVFWLLDATQPSDSVQSLSTIKNGEMAWAVDIDGGFFMEYMGDTNSTYNAKKIYADD